jgi:hypothetical protein
MVDLHAPPIGGSFDSVAGQINNRGHVIGSYDLGVGFRAF